MNARNVMLILGGALLCSATLFGQISGTRPQVLLSKYNLTPGKSSVILGDTLGLFGFRGWLPSNRFHQGAGIYAVVTEAPTNDGVGMRMNFVTGANTLLDRMTILENGFIGINTNNPVYLLDVNGDANVSGNFSVGGDFKVAGNIEAGLDVIAGRDVKAGRHVEATENVSGKNIIASQNITATGNLSGANLNITTDATVGNNANITQSLSVGNRVTIGLPNTTATPAGYRLYVADGILTEKVKVAIQNSGNWSDYVFQQGYQLRPLSEVEQFIQQHGHLPGVPSAQEVVEQGIDVAAMDAKLLEKIEELTLYMLQLKKENEALRKELETVKKSIH